MSIRPVSLAAALVVGALLLPAAAFSQEPDPDELTPVGYEFCGWRDYEFGGWALMASMFALGVMSLAWMVFVAALIALEKTLPWGRAVTYATALILLILGVVVIAAPDAVPGLMVPGDGGGMGAGSGAMPMR